MKIFFFLAWGIIGGNVFSQISGLEKEIFKKLKDPPIEGKNFAKWQAKANLLGYPEFSIDTVQKSVHFGKKYILHSFTVFDEDSTKISSVVWKKGEPFSWQRLNEKNKIVLEGAANAGYPLAELSHKLRYEHVDSSTVGVNIELYRKKKRFFTIDSISYPGQIREKPFFVESVIHIKKGDAFSQEKINQIVKSLRNSEYYRNVQPPKLSFTDSTVRLILEFDRIKTNRFDLLLGLLPPQNNTQKMQFTIFADFALVSTFRAGEIIKIKYEKLINQSQKLNLQFTQPYLFRLPVRFDFQFDLLKQDTSFLNRNLVIGGGYYLNPELRILFGYKQRSSNLISISRYQNLNWPPPPQLDSKSSSYQLGFQWQNLDNVLSPSKGIVMTILGNTGTRKILKVRGLENLDYERIGRIQPRQEIELAMIRYQKITKRGVAVFGFQGYYLRLKTYFENDLKMLGGYKILRGFNENQFFASSYAVLTLEYRLKLEELSYIGIFTDLSWLEYKTPTENRTFQPIGTGIALNFSTSLGIMSVSYAVGKYENLNFQPLRGRIHVGIINTF